MAKVKGPLLSINASGKIGERLTFSLRNSGQQVRFQRKQRDIITSSRTAQRTIYTAGILAWNNLTSGEKLTYVSLAYKMYMSGFNYFMQLYLTGQIGVQDSAIYGVGIYGTAIYGTP